MYFCNNINELIVFQALHIFHLGIIPSLNMIGQIHINSGIVLQIWHMGENDELPELSGVTVYSKVETALDSCVFFVI